jgi:hypothetical protein
VQGHDTQGPGRARARERREGRLCWGTRHVGGGRAGARQGGCRGNREETLGREGRRQQEEGPAVGHRRCRVRLNRPGVIVLGSTSDEDKERRCVGLILVFEFRLPTGE